MKKPRFTIVTATAGAEKSAACFQSWYDHAGVDKAFVAIRQDVHEDTADPPLRHFDVGVSLTCPDYLGPVPAFKLGVDLALQLTDPSGIIACLHDDLLIEEDQWDAKVMAYFNQHPEVGLLGFGGGTGLGADDIYQVPYNPMQLARRDFVSNMRDAESHGRRVTVPTRVACLDGFSQIGRAKYWAGVPVGSATQQYPRPLHVLEECGVIHHAYDAYLGAIATERSWQVTMLPIACHHYGGQTAVADSGYQEWARVHGPGIGGDGAIWHHSHRQVYDLLRGVLPLRF